MTNTVAQPQDPELRDALYLASLFAVIMVLLHVAINLYEAHTGWGYFRDEFYYIACGRHLAWGYVDHGPLVAVQARLSELLFGRSLAGLRFFSALAGGIMVFLTGILTWALGGKRAAQGLALLAISVTPQYLGADSFLSMNSCEPMFWMTALLALILIERGGSPRLWLLFGAASGLGLLNKHSMTFFLISLLLALLLTPQRRLLRSPWALAGVALMLLIAAPNLIWQVQHHWPTLEFLENGRKEHKNVALGPIAFLLAQWSQMHPLNLLVWGAGLVWLMRRAAWRWLGITYLLFLLLMMALHAKDYYVAPIYPILFAAGGLAWEGRRRAPAPSRLFAFPLLESALLLTGLLLLPMSNPVLSPQQWVTYADTLHLRSAGGKTEKYDTGPLPQFYADRFGWQEEVDQIQHVYDGLSSADKARVTIYCSNYGEAGAVNFLGHNLPQAISGQNTYWLWGPNGATGDLVISMNAATPEEMHENYDGVEIVGRLDTPWSMPFEHRNLYLLHHRKNNLTAEWNDFKSYI